MNIGNNKMIKVTWAQAVRDVLNTAMNRGQLPILIILIAFLFILYRLSPEDISKLTFHFLEGLESFYLVGYVLAGIIGLLWYRDAKKYRRMYSELEKSFKNFKNKGKTTQNRSSNR